MMPLLVNALEGVSAMAIQVTKWEATDGSLWPSMDAALKQDAAVEVEAWIRKTGLCRGGDYNPEMILDAILEDAGTLVPLLTEYSRAWTKAASPSVQPEPEGETPEPRLGAGNLSGAGSLLAPFRKDGGR
jgi:hypothetical protein